MTPKHIIKFKKFPARTVALYNASCKCGWKSEGGIDRFSRIDAQASAHRAESKEG